MKKEIRILFTGVGRRVELVQAFREASLCLDIPLKIYGADMTNTAPAIYYCDFYRPICGMKDPYYIDNLLSICSDDEIDLVIPTIDTDLLVLAENRSRFEEINTKVMISSPDKIKICRDKNNTSSFFVDCGLKAPMPVNDWTQYHGGFPAFIKPKDGSSSINAYKVGNIEQLKIYSTQIDDYIVQPYIEGPEYTIDVFCDWEGNPLTIVPRERLQVRAGEVLKTRITLDPIMIEETRSICKEFKPCGPITIQLIKDINSGDNYYIEINPRFGGGVPLSMKAGARSAEAILKLLDGIEVGDYQIADGAIYSRFDQSVCITEGVRQIKGVIFDLDDTLYSEKEYVKSGYKAVSDYLGSDYDDRLWSLFVNGKPAIDELLKELGRESEKEEVLKVYRDHKPNIHLYPDVSEMIENLKAKGIKVGIITDGRPEGQRNKIAALDLKVDDVIITDDLGGIQFRKPCDIAFRIMLIWWSLNPEDVVYVGDNPFKDFQAPQQLGMRYLWFRNEDGLYSGELVNCNNQLTSIKELLSIL